jgi:hypothetical protein
MNIAVILFATLLVGCVNSAVSVKEPTVDLTHIETIYVRQFPPDNHELNRLIASELRAMGYQATSGDEQPDNIDAVVTYRDKWRWDMSMYMLSIAIKVRDPKTDFPLAEGISLHTSVTRKTPEGMIRETLVNIFGQGPND